MQWAVVIVTSLALTSPALGQTRIDPLVKKFALDEGSLTPERQQLIREVLDAHATLPFALRSLSSDLSTQWLFRTPTEWQLDDTLGYGVHLVEHPNMTLRTLRALPPSKIDVNTGGTFDTQSSVKYFADEESLREEMNDNTGFSLGFSYEGFGLSADYQSGRLQTSQRKKNRRFFIVSYYGTQWLGSHPLGLTQDAAHYWTQFGRTAFYGRYGTHYVSRVQVKARLSIVYSFSSDSNEVLENFSTDAGLKASYDGFGIGITKKLQQVLDDYKSSVQIQTDVHATGHASQGLPEIIALDGEKIMEAAKIYIERLKTDRAGLPVVQYEIAPFASFDQDLGPLTKLTLAEAAAVNARIESTNHDADLVMDYHDFYGVTAAKQREFQDEIKAIRTSIAGAMLAGLNAQPIDDAKMAKDIQTELGKWTVFINDPKNKWPFDPAGPRIKFKAGATDAFEATITTPKSEVSDLTARLITIKYNDKEDKLPKALSSVANLSFKSVDAGTMPNPAAGSPPIDTIIYVTQPILIKADTKDEMWLDVRDRRGRSFTYLLSTKLGRQSEFSNPPVNEVGMVPGPR